MTLLTRIDLSHAPRLFKFPFTVIQIGLVTESRNNFSGTHPGHIEFCVRTTSEDEFSDDEVDGVQHRSRFPHVFVKVAGRVHKYKYDGRRDAFFFIYDSALYDRFGEYGVDLTQIAWEINIVPEVRRVMDELTALFPVSQHKGVADQIDALCWLLVQRLVALRNEPSKDTPDYNEEKIYEIASYIHLHYREEIDFDGLAAKYGMSRRSFYRYWKKCYAKSPAQYLIELKMEEAARMLSINTMQIGQIAVALNFVDTAYFIYSFRKCYGMTPLQYRKKIWAGVSGG